MNTAKPSIGPADREPLQQGRSTGKVVVIVPTYNESENIGGLIEALQAQFRTLPYDMHVLVVDDNSPDGTAELVRAAMRKHANVHLITGAKAGLGAAYIRGMQYALGELAADAVFEMDADFSHDPNDVPRLLAALENSADLVIGSRHTSGGSIPKDWGMWRKLNSIGGNWVARYVAGLYGIRDCTAGFRAIRASVLRHVDFASLGVKGYAFQVALLHQMVTLGARVAEVPVDFVDRKAGKSKLGLRDIAEFILNAWWIRLRSLQTFVRFAAVGASGTVVNLAVFTLLLEAGVNKFVASPLAIETSIVWNFLLNNYWTFRHRRTRDHTTIKGLKFNAVSLVSLIVSFSTFVALAFLLPRMSPQLDQFIGIVPAVLVNYFLNSYWTFRADPDVTADPSKTGTPRTGGNTPD